MVPLALALVIGVASSVGNAAAPAPASRRFLVLDERSDYELVYDFAAQACPDMNHRAHRRGDVPDAEPVAWYNPRTNTSTFMTATGGAATHAFVTAGMTLENLTKDDCARVVLNSR